MSAFKVHTLETAPSASKPTLEDVKKSWGMIPNLMAIYAESPVVLQGAFSMYGALGSGTLSPIEQQLVGIAAAREGNCKYCVAAHSTMAVGAKTPEEILKAVREGDALEDPKLETLRRTTIHLVEKRGWLSEKDQERFFAAGYSKAQLLEVIGWVALKVFTNYTNHVAGTPVDEAFLGQKWQPRA